MLLSAAALVLGIPLLLLGLRGRRTDDHPLCRRCGYDLTGRAEGATRCPECGSDLSRRRATRIGHRVRRRGLAGAGLLLLLIGGSGTSLLAWAGVRGFDPTPYEPLWWLRHRIAGPAADADRAFAEVARRVPLLTAEQLAPFADRALAVQANPAVLDVPAYALVEAIHAGGKLSADRWITYTSQIYTLGLGTPATVMVGDPIPTELVAVGSRLGNAWPMSTTEVVALSVDGRPVPLTDDMSLRMNNPSHLEAAYILNSSGMNHVGGPLLPASATAGLSPGRHTVAATVRLSLFDLNRPWSGHRYTLVDDTTYCHPLGTVDMAVSAPVTVVPPRPLTNDDESIRKAVEAGLVVTPILIHFGYDELHVVWHHPPVRLAYAVSVRTPEGPEQPVAHIQTGSPTGDVVLNLAFTLGVLNGLDHATVVFRPDPDAVRYSSDPTPIWGGVVARIVPIVRPAVATAADGDPPATQPATTQPADASGPR